MCICDCFFVCMCQLLSHYLPSTSVHTSSLSWPLPHFLTFAHLGYIHKCHFWELLAASINTSSQTEQSTQNLLKHGGKLFWLQMVFLLNSFYWLHLDF